jgi:hypothetical protein
MGSRVSAWIAILELGWTPIDAALAATKMKFHDRMKRQPRHSYVKQMIDSRDRDVTLGEVEGIAYETKALWVEAGYEDAHNAWGGTPEEDTTSWTRSRLIRGIRETSPQQSV